MRARQHVNPLGLTFETFRGSVPDIPADDLVECEIGCADAQFLFERARIAPERWYVGVEIREHLVDEVNATAREEGLRLRAVWCNACLHLDKVFARGRLSTVFVNFPDPWFKRRHHKRRMLNQELLAQICRGLAHGGLVLFQSDVWDVALDAIALFESADELVNELGEWSFLKERHPFGAMSWREQHCEAEGKPIWRLLYRRL